MSSLPISAAAADSSLTNVVFKKHKKNLVFSRRYRFVINQKIIDFKYLFFVVVGFSCETHESLDIVKFPRYCRTMSTKREDQKDVNVVHCQLSAILKIQLAWNLYFVTPSHFNFRFIAESNKFALAEVFGWWVTFKMRVILILQRYISRLSFFSNFYCW